jgi:hypothetical protein
MKEKISNRSSELDRLVSNLLMVSVNGGISAGEDIGEEHVAAVVAARKEE